jgi:pilus assembly protein CpaC
MFKQRWAALSAKVGLFAALTFSIWLPTVAVGQVVTTEPVTFDISGATQRLEMITTSSRILTLDQKIPRLLVNNPEIIRATPISPNQIQVSALRPGVTQLNVWDEDQQLYTVDVVVSPDARELQMLLQSEFPDAAVRVRPLANSVYLTGYVPSPATVGSIVRMAEDYYPSVINNLTISGVQQVLLKVKVMEVSRTKLRALGFDWAALNGSDFVIQSVSGLVQAGADPASFAATAGDTIRFGLVDGDRAFFGFLEALRQNNLIKVLAEPTLVTVSGRPASFNSGGEFPIIVPQSLGTVSVEYRQFGTRVDFVPIVLGNGNLRLEVRPTVSEIDPARSVTINNVTVPGLRTRYVDTAVEMKSGQTLALAGLIQTRVEAENRGIPWLADLPYFGVPFRRVEEVTNEVELLIMVSPEFVDAVDPHELPPCGPGETTSSPNDCELYFRGYLEVPNCCDDGSCPQCMQGQPGMAPGMEEVLPQEAMPQEVLPPEPDQSEFDGAARRPNTPTRQAAVPHRGPVRASIRGEAPAGKKPQMIGPVGYDELK